MEKGIFIPIEILSDERLDLTEKVILAIYKYYTVEGDAHCCFLTKEQIVELIGTSPKTVQRVKNRLKELNLIDTDGGIRTWYTGGTNCPGRGDKMTPQGGQNDSPRGDKMTPKIKNKIKKNKERNKDTYNLSTIEQIENTYNISDSKGDKNRPDWALDDDDMVTPKPTVADIYGLEFSNLVHQYWIDNDSLPLCDYYRQHPTDDISNAIKKALNDSDLQGFENFKNSLNNSNIKSLHY